MDNFEIIKELETRVKESTGLVPTNTGFCLIDGAADCCYELKHCFLSLFMKDEVLHGHHSCSVTGSSIGGGEFPITNEEEKDKAIASIIEILKTSE